MKKFKIKSKVLYKYKRGGTELGLSTDPTTETTGGTATLTTGTSRVAKQY